MAPRHAVVELFVLLCYLPQLMILLGITMWLSTAHWNITSLHLYLAEFMFGISSIVLVIAEIIVMVTGRPRSSVFFWLQCIRSLLSMAAVAFFFWAITPGGKDDDVFYGNTTICGGLEFVIFAPLAYAIYSRREETMSRSADPNNEQTPLLHG